MNDQYKETHYKKTKMQIQPQPHVEKKVAVIYYLSRNGQLDHPHFIEVPLSSSQGLYLRDVMKTLSILRGQGVASMYSWASKRRYKNSFIWQDLSDDDFIYPCHDQDYILKGSLLFNTSLSFRSTDSLSSPSNSSRHSSEINYSNSDLEDSNSTLTKRKTHSFSSVDDNIHEEKLYKAKTTGELYTKGSNMSTQTDNNRRMKTLTEGKTEGLDIAEVKSKEVSAPALKSIGLHRSASCTYDRYEKIERGNPSVRLNDPNILMKLIGCGCGSKRFKDFEMMENKY